MSLPLPNDFFDLPAREQTLVLLDRVIDVLRPETPAEIVRAVVDVFTVETRDRVAIAQAEAREAQERIEELEEEVEDLNNDFDEEEASVVRLAVECAALRRQVQTLEDENQELIGVEVALRRDVAVLEDALNAERFSPRASEVDSDSW